ARLAKRVRELGEGVGHLARPAGLEGLTVGAAPGGRLQTLRDRGDQRLDVAGLVVELGGERLDLFRDLAQESAHGVFLSCAFVIRPTRRAVPARWRRRAGRRRAAAARAG